METILEPDLPIIDPHHHLWDARPRLAHLPDHVFMEALKRRPLYLADELIGDMRAGHNVRATVYLECGGFYRTDGPDAFKPVGETEYVAAVAEKAANGACAAIIGHVDLRIGAAARDVLEAHVAAGGGRFRGIRHGGSWDADPAILGPLNVRPEGLYRDKAFREGFAQLAPMGLSFDAWLLEPQLGDLIDLARAFPDTTIVLDHVGTPLGMGAYRLKDRFDIWRESIRTLASCKNVNVKLGGLAMVFPNFPSTLQEPPASSQQLADEWRPYVETCVEAFGANRCMFESNFPVDGVTCDYATLWNAFKRIAKDASASEKAALFHDAAARVYRIS